MACGFDGYKWYGVIRGFEVWEDPEASSSQGGQPSCSLGKRPETEEVEDEKRRTS